MCTSQAGPALRSLLLLLTTLLFFFFYSFHLLNETQLLVISHKTQGWSLQSNISMHMILQTFLYLVERIAHIPTSGSTVSAQSDSVGTANEHQASLCKTAESASRTSQELHTVCCMMLHTHTHTTVDDIPASQTLSVQSPLFSLQLEQRVKREMLFSESSSISMWQVVVFLPDVAASLSTFTSSAQCENTGRDVCACVIKHL